MSNILDTSVLHFEGNFDAQVCEILKYIRKSKEEVEQLDILFKELQHIVESSWRGSKIEVFGSVVTGLALKNSDVDILCQLPPWLNQPRACFVLQAKEILSAYRDKFKNLFTITQAKVPIVQFYHAPSRTHCDLSFSGPMALYNSELLEYWVWSDDRILPLVILIKYWSKIHNFTGQNLMPNYCLTLLVMFYLQQKNILPPFKDLQRNCEWRLVDNWNSAFSTNSIQINHNENLYSMLGSFFLYYRNFRFDKCIISLYTGRLIERENFACLENVPEEFNLYCENVRNKKCKELRLDTFMCVQDPIDHSRNCAVAVHPKLALRIMQYFNNAASIYDREQSNNFLKNLLYTEESSASINRPRLRNRGIKKQKWKQNQNARNFKKKVNLYNQTHQRW